MKLTDWFPTDIKPVRAGVYELSWADTKGRPTYKNMPYPFHWFDGKGWSTLSASGSPCVCARNFANRPDSGGREIPSYAGFWRGLAEKPE